MAVCEAAAVHHHGLCGWQSTKQQLISGTEWLLWLSIHEMTVEDNHGIKSAGPSVFVKTYRQQTWHFICCFEVLVSNKNVDWNINCSVTPLVHMDSCHWKRNNLWIWQCDIGFQTRQGSVLSFSCIRQGTSFSLPQYFFNEFIMCFWSCFNWKMPGSCSFWKFTLWMKMYTVLKLWELPAKVSYLCMIIRQRYVLLAGNPCNFHSELRQGHTTSS